MKGKVYVIGVLLFSSVVAKAATCEGEAQIIAKVDYRETDSLTYCRAQIDPDSIRFFKPSGVCPLKLETVLDLGVELRLTNGHDCDVYPEQEISGVLVLKNGKITIE